jgi:hypothetical protein
MDTATFAEEMMRYRICALVVAEVGLSAKQPEVLKFCVREPEAKFRAIGAVTFPCSCGQVEVHFELNSTTVTGSQAILGAYQVVRLD